MKRLLLMALFLLVGCGSEPPPEPPPEPQHTAMALTSAAEYAAERDKITTCGNTIVETNVGDVAGAFKFRGYSSAVACYERFGRYGFFVKI